MLLMMLFTIGPELCDTHLSVLPSHSEAFEPAARALSNQQSTVCTYESGCRDVSNGDASPEVLVDIVPHKAPTVDSTTNKFVPSQLMSPTQNAVKPNVIQSAGLSNIQDKWGIVLFQDIILSIHYVIVNSFGTPLAIPGMEFRGYLGIYVHRWLHCCITRKFHNTLLDRPDLNYASDENGHEALAYNLAQLCLWYLWVLYPWCFAPGSEYKAAMVMELEEGAPVIHGATSIVFLHPNVPDSLMSQLVKLSGVNPHTSIATSHVLQIFGVHVLLRNQQARLRAQ